MHIQSAIKFVGIAVFVLYLTGCANRMEATIAPGTDFESIKTVHVVKFDPDERGIEKLIEAGLNQRGLNATSGAREEAPANADAIITYIDKWMWDITMYMLELTVVFRSPDSDFPLATGNSMHTSLTRRSKEEMVEEVLTNIFAEAEK